MFKGTKFFAAVGLLAAQPLQAAVSLSTDGTGQGLLFPYATVEQGNTTVIAIDNTRDRAKAIKWHVRESREGHIAAIGVAYVPAHGRWTMNLLDDHLIGDISLLPGNSGCMASDPGLTAQHISRHEFPDGEPSGMDFWPTATVTFDAVEMGELDAALTDAVAKDCSQLWKRWKVFPANDLGAWAKNPRSGVTRPTGGLRGRAILLDIEDATFFDYPAVAFNGLGRSVRTDILHFQTPYLTDVEPEKDGYIHVALPGGETLRYPPWRGTDAIAALLAANVAGVEFASSPLEGGRSDIVVSLPLRSAYVGGVIDEPYNEDSLNNPPKIVAPFTDAQCEDVEVSVLSAQGAKMQSAAVDLCGLSTVLRIRHPATSKLKDLVADERAIDVPAGGSGTMLFDFAGANQARRVRRDVDGKCWTGLPVWILSLSAYDKIKARPGQGGPYVRTDTGVSTLVVRKNCR